jgi:hypothetical protein
VRVDIFARTYNRRGPGFGRVRGFSLTVPAGSSLPAILDAYLAAGGSKGNGTHAGPFEVQTDEGIWSHPAGHSLLAWHNRNGFRPSSRAVFRSWEELEALERAESAQGVHP